MNRLPTYILGLYKCDLSHYKRIFHSILNRLRAFVLHLLFNYASDILDFVCICKSFFVNLFCMYIGVTERNLSNKPNLTLIIFIILGLF